MDKARLRQRNIKETSSATHLRHLRAALGWAKSIGMLVKMPVFEMPKRARGSSHMRGRPITAEEFERLLAAVPAVRPQDAEVWRHFLMGLWLSGLRLGESLVLSWDEEAMFSVDLAGKRPRLRILAEGEKGHRDRLLPMTPDFARFLWETPQAKRQGLVFKITRLGTGAPITQKRVGRTISAIGRRAGVVVNKAERKFESAHDLRWAFGTRWASRVKPVTLQLLMRHSSIETTLKYYVGQNADEVAEELWNADARQTGIDLTIKQIEQTTELSMEST